MRRRIFCLREKKEKKKMTKQKRKERKENFFCYVQSNYEPLNRNNDCIGLWSWYYRGCWHQTCPPLEFRIPVHP